jgi:beta-galactosidase
VALAVASAHAEGCLTLSFNPGWKFIKTDPAGASARDFNDSEWTNVSAPHTFNDTDAFGEWSPLGHIGQTNQWTGRTWYRKSFNLPEGYQGRRVYLEFEAVRQVAEVYLNGQPLGTNRTGFIPFGFDLTPHLRFGDFTNVLAVMADNRFTGETLLARIAATELPWNSPHWHPAHGGIYRNVYLHITDPLHITLPLYSSLKTAGSYVYATNISDESATVHCEVPVQNGRSQTEAVTARVEFLDREGKAVLRLEEAKTVAAGALETFRFSGKVAAPQLWEPSYPYLYKAICTLATRNKDVDSCAVPFGIRQVRWDVKTGFYINGHHIKLRGWGQRPTSEWPGLGAAQPDWMHYYTLAQMKEAGGNFIRWGHCAGAPVALRLTSLLGPGGWLADGADVALVDVEAVDAHGERCPTFQQRVDFDIAGPAVWRGGYNSDFKPTDLHLTVNGQNMDVFERPIRSGESLTLGSNAEDRRLKSSNIYIVFVTRTGNGSRASL